MNYLMSTILSQALFTLLTKSNKNQLHLRAGEIFKMTNL